MQAVVGGDLNEIALAVRLQLRGTNVQVFCVLPKKRNCASASCCLVKQRRLPITTFAEAAPELRTATSTLGGFSFILKLCTATNLCKQ